MVNASQNCLNTHRVCSEKKAEKVNIADTSLRAITN